MVSTTPNLLLLCYNVESDQMKLMYIFWVDGIRIYGYTIKGYEGIIRSMRFYPETWRIPMIKDIRFD